MSSTLPVAPPSRGRPVAPELGGGAYTGWLVSGLVILAIMAIGAVLWFAYHPW